MCISTEPTLSPYCCLPYLPRETSSFSYNPCQRDAEFLEVQIANHLEFKEKEWSPSSPAVACNRLSCVISQPYRVVDRVFIRRQTIFHWHACLDYPSLFVGLSLFPLRRLGWQANLSEDSCMLYRCLWLWARRVWPMQFYSCSALCRYSACSGWYCC